MARLAEAALESPPDPHEERPEDTLLPEDVRDVEQPDGLAALDGRLAALCRERGPLRAVLARIAWHLVGLRAWERIGYARLSDYAAERLGLSARSVRSLALVAQGFRVFPRLEEALVSGMLGWTKVRLLARLPRGEDEAGWIARARRLTAEQLSKMVRAVDRGSLDAPPGEADEPERSRLFEVSCTAEVCRKWYAAKGAASRAAGRMVRVAEAAELIAAEVLSALPIDDDGPVDEEGCDETSVSWSQASEVAEDVPAGELAKEAAAPASYGLLEPLLAGLEEADAFELDERFRPVLCLEQRLDARIGPLLALVWNRWVHRALGYSTREAYARERLGMDPTRARALVRLERAAAVSEPFARAYRTGELSWVKAAILVPLVSADPLGRFMEDWVAWAGQVMVRRLREDVEWALTLEQTDPAAFRQSGGLPPEVRGEREAREREIGAVPRDRGRDTLPRPVQEIGAPPRETEEETCWVRFIGPADIVHVFRTVLCTVRRRMERDIGRLPTEGEALDAMLDHALSSWGVRDTKVAARHRIFDRDGWLCAVPGCTSMENLHDHHIRFRAGGGSDDSDNRVTLCAFHRLRGVHAARLRCVGRAPDRLTWQMGLRPGGAPLVAYRSGDRQAFIPRAASPAVPGPPSAR